MDGRKKKKKKKKKRSIYRCIIAVNNRPIVPILNRLVHRGKCFVVSVLKITRGTRSGKPRADARLFQRSEMTNADRLCVGGEGI